MDLALTASLATALVGGLVGVLAQRRLDTLDYRYPDEADRPAPRAHWWVPLGYALVLGGLVWRHTSIGHPEQLLFLLPVAVVAPWLAAVDLDVHRLPYRPTITAGLAAAAGIAAATILTSNPWLAIAALAGLAGCWVVFWVLHKGSGGQLGAADVRLAGLIGLTTAPLGGWATWTAIAAGSLAAALWALTLGRHHRRHPYGPWLLAGWLLAALTF